MPQRLTVIGDKFLLPSIFGEILQGTVGRRVEVSLHALGWPDEETIAGGNESELREYSGEPAAVIAAAAGAQGLIVHMAPVSARVMDALPELRFVAVCRGGPVNVNLAEAKRRGIRVVRTPGRNADAVAEYTIGGIIALTRRMVAAHETVRGGEWLRGFYRYADAGPELSQMTVGLVGFAHIGRKVARLLQPFRCKILFSDPFQELTVRDRQAGVEKVTFEELLERADVISLHARLTPETAGMINGDSIRRMKPGSFLVNTARGELVDHSALCAALQSGQIRGAVLDTFDPEPPAPNDPLLALPNVIVTPHIAGASRTSAYVSARMAAEEVRRWLDGEPPANGC
jgi:D-3-phosphoglycerate dehydrogenase / 2-oxoglutarate reductase